MIQGKRPGARARILRFAPAALVLAVVLAYAGTLRAPFVFDDAGAVVDNPTIRDLGSWRWLRPPSDGSTTTGRPLVNFTFALNYALGGENVWGYHAFNLAIHAAAALVLFGLVRRTIERTARPAAAGAEAEQSGAAAVVAFFIALLWALHPLQSETVICVAQRTESLCALFYLLTLSAFARGRPGVSVLAALAGMATKEVMVTAPLVVLLFDRTFFAGTFAGAWRARRRYYTALAGTWLLLALLLVSTRGARGVSAGFELGVSPWHYLLTQAKALVLYLRLAVWPHPLVLDYGTASVASPAAVWPEALVVLALFGGTVWALVRRPRAGFFGAAFFLLLAPSSSVVPLVTQTIAEHRMYLPLAVAIAAAVLVCWRMGTRVALAAGAMGLAGLALTVARGRDYRDAIALWTDNVEKCPTARAEHNLALALQQAGRPAEAEAHFARAVARDPDYVAARHNWAVALLAQQRTAEAIAQFRAAIRSAEARAPAARAPAETRALADAHLQLALLAERAGEPAAAEGEFEAVLRLEPSHAAAHAKLGRLLARTQRFAAADAHLREAIRLAPGDSEAHALLGNSLLLQGRVREAVACYEEALRLRPDDVRTRENLALARAALR